jgi:hypothetical protein
MGWQTFWPISSQTHPVTLVLGTGIVTHGRWADNWDEQRDGQREASTHVSHKELAIIIYAPRRAIN